MVPSSFAESDDFLNPPDSMKDDCLPLSIARREFGGYPGVISCWRPTAEELAEINKTGRVWLVVIGQTMPPVILDGRKPSELG